jgi:hypothetical protein
MFCGYICTTHDRRFSTTFLPVRDASVNAPLFVAAPKVNGVEDAVDVDTEKRGKLFNV